MGFNLAFKGLSTYITTKLHKMKVGVFRNLHKALGRHNPISQIIFLINNES